LFGPEKASIEARYRHLAPQVDDVKTLLDYGCANGDFLTVARSMGWSVKGVDFDPIAVELARGKGLDVDLIEAGELQMGEGLYDVITLSHVLEHVHDPLELISDLFRLLKPGGVLWLETPNISCMGHRIFGRFWYGLDPPRHLLIFSSRALRAILAGAGFRDIRTRWHGLAVFVWFPASDALQRGGNAMTLVGTGSLLLKQVACELMAWVFPSSREFITLTARKPLDQ
ncbi:MAG: class I SAM-dependent methyltransferase, partial [Polaribacter sp.]|uniref:class I SAM-dependent methyltransferase n=1 Tax=Polaribacter sp. TaxID=1920175 RepID=UPI003BAE1A5B